MSDHASTPPVRHVALIGNFPPRRCGIATFTADLHAALRVAEPEAKLSTIVMTDPGMAYAYPQEVDYEIAQERLEDYLAAAEHINALNPDVICVQHEFGIFGGRSGEHLAAMLDKLRAPVVTTLHTILPEPDEDQRRVLERVAGASSRLVAMTEMGRTILTRDLGITPKKVSVIPHGIPDLPFLDPAFEKRRFGLDARDVVLTFGLLSPNKGIEVMIAALPQLVERHPDLTYVILGATHPHSRKFTDMRRQDCRTREGTQPIRVAGKIHEDRCIQHQLRLAQSQQVPGDQGGGFGVRHSRTSHDSIAPSQQPAKRSCTSQRTLAGARLRQREHHDLGHGDPQSKRRACNGRHLDLARPGAQCRLGGDLDTAGNRRANANRKYPPATVFVSRIVGYGERIRPEPVAVEGADLPSHARQQFGRARM